MRKRKDEPPADAIDRVVRDMTRIEADGDSVARVLARVRAAAEERSGASARGGAAEGADRGAIIDRRLGQRGKRRPVWAGLLTPRVAWVCAALLFLVLTVSYWIPRHPGDGRELNVRSGASSPSSSGLARHTPPSPAHDTPPSATATREVPTASAPHASTAQPATTVARAATRAARVRTASTRTADDAARDAWTSDLLPRDSDIVMAGIAPATLAAPETPSVQPLETQALALDAIPVQPIDVTAIDASNASAPRQ